MYNNIPFSNNDQMDCYRSQLQNTQPNQSGNRFIYVKQQFSQPIPPVNRSKTVLVNPHFQGQLKANNSKVFVNPKFSGSSSIHVNPKLKTPVPRQEPQVTHKIHVNPNMKNIQLPVTAQTVHINPKFTNIIANTLNSCSVQEMKENTPVEKIKLNKAVVVTKTKLIRSHSPQMKLKRRNSIKSKYKIVKTGCSPKKSNPSALAQQGTHQNRYKIDNRRNKSQLLGVTSPGIVKKHHKKFIYYKSHLSVNHIVKSAIVRGSLGGSIHKIVRGVHNTVNIRGVTYCKSRNSIQRASVGTVNKAAPKDRNKKVNNINLARPRRSIVKKFKIIRRNSPKKAKERVLPKKLKKCNIPCPFYRKHGICKGKDNGKCIWKHDPDQVALCTRFLQGACLKEKCLLSHNVSPEKMPTCKYYLEGACSKENCPYLHVKISPKADVCRDFLEGFCKKAAECDKKHQYLCPDYDKYGKCVKQRCAYPHGKMVRTYLMNKNKFVKKFFEFEAKEIVPPKKSVDIVLRGGKSGEKKRYYVGKDGEDFKKEDIVGKDGVDSKKEDNIVVKNDNVHKGAPLKTFVGLRSRPQLGSLPSFIPFGDSL